MTLREANAFVEQHHRHHKTVVGHKFSIGCSDGEKIVGVAIVGLPLFGRWLDVGGKPTLYRRKPQRLLHALCCGLESSQGHGLSQTNYLYPGHGARDKPASCWVEMCWTSWWPALDRKAQARSRPMPGANETKVGDNRQWTLIAASAAETQYQRGGRCAGNASTQNHAPATDAREMPTAQEAVQTVRLDVRRLTAGSATPGAGCAGCSRQNKTGVRCGTIIRMS